MEIDGQYEKLIESSGVQITLEEKNARNVLIIGITGSGKSALANALTNTNQFEEESFGTSVTKSFQKSDNPFELNGINYYVIDNIGFGDTSNISESDILYNIGRGIYLAKEGINQVLFVFKDKFSPEQINNFNSFKKFVSESKITRFTTLIRTNFEDFRNSQACEQDRKILLSENNNLREIINSCNSIIHIENPPIPVIDEDDSERQKVKKEEKRNRNKKKRDDSREVVLNHLTEKCPDVY